MAVPGNGDAASDEVLAGRAGRGDSAALSLLLNRWCGPLKRYCRRLTRHDEDALDLAQDAVLRAARAMPSYDSARPFAPWIYRIAMNACLNHLDELGKDVLPDRLTRRVLEDDALGARGDDDHAVRRPGGGEVRFIRRDDGGRAQREADAPLG